MVRKGGTLVPITAHAEVRIWARTSDTVSSGFIFHDVAFRTPWDHVEGTASLDLCWSQGRRGSWNRVRIGGGGTG